MSKKKNRKIRAPSRPKLVIFPSEEMMTECELGTPGPTIDALGRVNGKTYPEFLGTSAKEAEIAVKRVTIIKDSTLTYPTLCLKIFVQPDPAVSDDEARFAKLFARAGCRRADVPLEADLVVFAGGADVDPVLYGETRHETTFTSPTRDQKDMDLYLLCREHGIPMLGICRGAQFLSVMNGGKLFQNVDGHMGNHSMFDILHNQNIEKVSSVHHQMVMQNVRGGMEIIATSAKSHERALNHNNYEIGVNADIEAYWYRSSCCIGIQGHPEYEGYHFFQKWTLDLLNELVFENPDLEWQGSCLRMKKELILEEKLIQENT